MSKKGRLEKLETGLTPKHTFLLCLQEAHAFDTVEEYIRHLKPQPDSAWPIGRMTTQVEDGVRQALKGQPREKINRSVRRAYKVVLFLFFLHHRVNAKLLTENRYYWTRFQLLSKELRSLMREQSLDRQIRWNRIRAEMQMPYRLDQETAGAIDAAKQHHVLTWEVLEEGDDIGQRVVDHFVAEGKTALPYGAYLVRSGIKSSYMPAPSEDEVRDLFKDEEGFQKFLAGEDYSYGLSDVPDAEYDAHYEAIVLVV